MISVLPPVTPHQRHLHTSPAPSLSRTPPHPCSLDEAEAEMKRKRLAVERVNPRLAQAVKAANGARERVVGLVVGGAGG